MTDRKPQASAPTAPQQPQRPQQRGTNGVNGANGAAQGRGAAAGGPAGGASNGTARPQAQRPRVEEPPTEQIPAVRDESAPSKAPAAKPSEATQQPGTRLAQAEKQPAAQPRKQSPASSKVATAGSIAASEPIDRTQAIPVVREPLREKSPEPEAKTDAASPLPATDDDATDAAPGKTKRGRKDKAAKEPKPEPEPVSTRKARLRLTRLDPWSVMKTAFALSVSLAIVTVVAVTIVWAVLDLAGVWDAINSSVATILSDNADAFDVTDYVGFGRIIGFTLLIAAVNTLLLTALATVGAFLYNLSASLMGGLEVTLAEDN
ncbi:DUF3566 domain-containing protein [Solicola sp. PLA-1-18]|uniref:DUF3566 domain-containing protein n=1 Tax=Solicola sp. PLA-1-18 TaxID=3380532 RepID=UPI003B7809E0